MGPSIFDLDTEKLGYLSGEYAIFMATGTIVGGTLELRRANASTGVARRPEVEKIQPRKPAPKRGCQCGSTPGCVPNCLCLHENEAKLQMSARLEAG